MLFRFLISISFLAIIFACSQSEKHAGGSVSETQNAEITLVESRPNLARANSKDTLRRWEFDIPQSDLVWTLQLQGSLQNASLIEFWKAHIGNKNLAFDEKTLSPLKIFQGEIINTKIIESINEPNIEIDFKLKNDTTVYLMKSKISVIKEFDDLVVGSGTLWNSKTIDSSSQFFYASCSGGLDENAPGNCLPDSNRCSLSKVIMCTNSESPQRPSYEIYLDSTVENNIAEWSQGWSQKKFIMGKRVIGLEITSKAVGDSICQSSFGSQSQWASDSLSKYIEGMNATNHIGEDFANSSQLQTGGWGFYGYWTNTGPTQSTDLWVHSNKPMANCWWE